LPLNDLSTLYFMLKDEQEVKCLIRLGWFWVLGGKI